MAKKKGSPQVKWTNMGAVRIYSNVPFDMLFKYELDVGCTLEMWHYWQWNQRGKLTFKRELRNITKEKQYNISLFSIIVVVVTSVIVIVVVFIVCGFKVNFLFLAYYN